MPKDGDRQYNMQSRINCEDNIVLCSLDEIQKDKTPYHRKSGGSLASFTSDTNPSTAKSQITSRGSIQSTGSIISQLFSSGAPSRNLSQVSSKNSQLDNRQLESGGRIAPASSPQEYKQIDPTLIGKSVLAGSNSSLPSPSWTPLQLNLINDWPTPSQTIGSLPRKTSSHLQSEIDGLIYRKSTLSLEEKRHSGPLLSNNIQYLSDLAFPIFVSDINDYPVELSLNFESSPIQLTDNWESQSLFGGKRAKESSKKYICPHDDCKKPYSSYNGLKYHRIQVHGDISGSPELPILDPSSPRVSAKEWRFACKFEGCQMVYKSLGGLRYHLDRIVAHGKLSKDDLNSHLQLAKEGNHR